jgi:uncharacterized protein YeaO (DUF488 family)
VSLKIKRAYDPADDSDGHRILVDRLWPRGLTKERAAVDEWLRDVAPSTELRHWFGHEPDRWSEFRRRYHAELKKEPAATALGRLRELAMRQRVTLLYGARDAEHNHAVVLMALLRAHHG